MCISTIWQNYYKTQFFFRFLIILSLYVYPWYRDFAAFGNVERLWKLDLVVGSRCNNGRKCASRLFLSLLVDANGKSGITVPPSQIDGEWTLSGTPFVLAVIISTYFYIVSEYKIHCTVVIDRTYLEFVKFHLRIKFASLPLWILTNWNFALAVMKFNFLIIWENTFYMIRLAFS